MVFVLISLRYSQENSEHVVSHYRKWILRKTCNNLAINRKIFCKLVHWSFVREYGSMRWWQTISSKIQNVDCRSDDSDKCFPEFDVLPVDYRREVGSTLSSASLILPHCDNVGLNLSCICFFILNGIQNSRKIFRYDTIRDAIFTCAQKLA